MSLEDVASADKLGYAVKLIASVTQMSDGKILPIVTPMLIPYSNLLSHVNDVFNAVMVWGDAIDKTMFYGRGAGKFPTASAVMGDIINCAQHRNTVLSLEWEPAENQNFIENVDNYTSMWYLRSNVSAEKIADAVKKNGAEVVKSGENDVIVSEMKYSDFKKLKENLKNSGVEPVSVYPVAKND